MVSSQPESPEYQDAVLYYTCITRNPSLNTHGTRKLSAVHGDYINFPYSAVMVKTDFKKSLKQKKAVH